MAATPTLRVRRRAVAAAALLVVGLVAGAVPEAGAVNPTQSVVVSPDPANWTPEVLDGRVLSIVQVGGTMVVGGTFTSVRAPGGAAQSRPYLFAFDATTGALSTTFLPRLDRSVDVVAAHPDGTSVIVGGEFTTVNGTAAKKLAKINVTTGQLDTKWKARTSGRVRDVVVSGNRLYVGGAFTAASGVARGGLAAFNVTTGVLDPDVDVAFTVPRRGTTHVAKLDVTPDGSTLVAIGNFLQAGGLARAQIAMLDVASRPARVTDWQTDRFSAACSSSFDTYMRDIDISPDGRYFVVVTTGAGFTGTLCDAASRWELGRSGAGQQPTWVDLTGGDTLYSVAITGTAVYIGGHQRWVNNSLGRSAAGPGAVVREGIAALDPVNGLPFSWNPGKERGVGAFTLVATSAGLWVGSDTDWVGGEYHPRLALFPLVGGTAVPAPTVPTLPGELGRLGLDDRLTATSTDGTTLGASRVVDEAVTWSRARGAFVVGGDLYHGWDDGTFQRRSLADGTVGAATALPSPLSTRTITGMYFDAGKLHYTLARDSRLHWRWFTPESGVVGADDFVVSGPSSWSDASGLTLAGGKAYWARGGDGALLRADVVDGLPVAATVTVVSTADWRSRGLTALPSAAAGPPPGPVAPFATDFSGGMAGWDRVVGFSVDSTAGATAAPSARASVAGSTAVMRATLATPATTVCQSQAVKVDSLGATLVLARFKSSTGGAVGRLYLKATGELVLRSDVTAAQAFSKVLLPLGTWSTVELCGTVGTAGTLQVEVNGTSVLGPWTADLGTTAIGTIQVGDDSATTATVSVDDVRVTTP
ncbi:MAG: domain containing protein [Acidimicrobiales bacterium]|nr:domain containing protein [Acidimicrobiales bacterium]